MERIFYRSDLKDPETQLPIYVFDTTYLPQPDDIDYEKFILVLMQILPKFPYALIMFSSGLNKINWIWGVKFLKKFLSDNLTNNASNLKKIITVHDSWFVKTLTQVFTNLNFTKKSFAQLNAFVESFSIAGKDNMSNDSSSVRINCSSLSSLNEYVNITKLKISLNIYKYDYQLDHPEDLLKSIYPPLITAVTKINPTTDPIFHHHFYQIFNIININGDQVELLFHRPGNKLKSEILFDCVNRNQLIWVNDWDIYSIAITFKKFLMELPRPLIPVEQILLPMKDEYEYTVKIFDHIINGFEDDEGYRVVLLQFLDLCHKILINEQVTKHTTLSLSKCLSHCLSHQVISSQNKDEILIVNRFIKNLLSYWVDIKDRYSFSYSISEIILGDLTQDDKVDESYDLGYEMMDQGISDGDEVEFRSDYISVLPTSNFKFNKNSLTCNSSESEFESKNLQMQNLKTQDKLSDISNVIKLRPAGTYKLPYIFDANHIIENNKDVSLNNATNMKKPVIRGRKVGELAKLFEERAHGIEILKGM
ncbi:uncharacterized protein PRCAT00001155001 [Priceomyces carsonii]|uniref:uncharacterized protein n=1 Tax=Priceomyces carsonii TaxID=28549 RepID=UPI002EDB5F54|nr:unnamed protein product [Priceomyces carsonii]